MVCAYLLLWVSGGEILHSVGAYGSQIQVLKGSEMSTIITLGIRGKQR